MKRYFSLLPPVIFAVLLFAGCESDSLHCAISNNSSYPVSFQFRSVYTDEFALHPGETEIYDSIGNPSLNYFKINGVFQNEKRKQVEYRISHRDAEFIDFSAITIKVYNTLSIPVELSADGYMATDPMPINASEIDKVNIIYTETPNFVVTTDTYSAVADYTIQDDGIMYLTIH
jgi:hypothetical protein